MDLGLKNRVALVAASSQGIGLATAEAFAAEGCRVAMCARNRQTLEAAAEKIRKQYSADVFAEAFDVGDPASVSQFVAADPCAYRPGNHVFRRIGRQQRLELQHVGRPFAKP